MRFGSDTPIQAGEMFLKTGDEQMGSRIDGAQRWAGGHWWASLLVVALLWGGVGCEKSPADKLRQANALLVADKKPDKAAKLLEEVLEAKPKNMEARRLMAKAYRLRGEYKRAEEMLTTLWERAGFDRANGELSAQMKNNKELVRSEFVALYTRWAEQLDPADQPDRFVETARRGLSYEPKDRQLNKMLVDYYWKSGQRLVEAGRKQEAAEAYEKILELRTIRGDERRVKARKKARDLRLEFFMAEGRKRFESKGADLIGRTEGLSLAEEGKTIRIDIVQEVDRKLDPEVAEQAQKAKQIAHIGLIDKLRKLTLVIAGLPDKTDLRKVGVEKAKRLLLADVSIEETKFEPGEYTIKASLPVEKAVAMAYEIKTAYEEAEAAEGRDEKGEEAKSGAGEGEETDSGTPEGETDE